MSAVAYTVISRDSSHTRLVRFEIDKCNSSLSGNIRFGPDVFWTDNPTDFTFSSFTKQQCDAFIEEINTYLPSVQANELEVDYTGIRPKLGKHWSDFRLDFGLDGTTLQCLGIESPGLTSCLSIGEFVCRELFGKI